MTKMMLVLALSAGAVTAIPRPAAAEECTAEYAACLNETWHYKGMLKTLADISCFSSYAGCVARQAAGK